MKYGFWGVLLLLVVSNGYWFYSAVDSGITQTYQEVSYQDCERQAAQLEKIANHFVSGKLLSEVQPFLISTAEPGSSFPKPADHLFIVGNLALKLGPNEKVQALVRDPYKP